MTTTRTNTITGKATLTVEGEGCKAQRFTLADLKPNGRGGAWLQARYQVARQVSDGEAELVGGGRIEAEGCTLAELGLAPTFEAGPAEAEKPAQGSGETNLEDSAKPRHWCIYTSRSRRPQAAGTRPSCGR